MSVIQLLPPPTIRSPGPASQRRLPQHHIVKPMPDRYPRRSSSHNSLLGPVLEDATDQTCRTSTPPSSSRPTSSRGARGCSSRSMADTLQGGRWMLDVDKMCKGKERWCQRERVILVLGDAPNGGLDPLLTCPSLSNTLVITSSSSTPSQTPTAIHTLPSGDIESQMEDALSASLAYRKLHKKFRSKSLSKQPCPPFDAILHLLPSPLRYNPTQALQRILQEAIVVTTMITAVFASSSLAGMGDAQCPLVHVLPPDCPKPLPIVLERYLLQLLCSPSGGKTGGRTAQSLRPLILTSEAWLARMSPSLPNAAPLEPVLFGGLAPAQPNRQVIISSWNDVSSPPPPSASSSSHHALNTACTAEMDRLEVPDAPWTWAMDRRDSEASTASSSSSTCYTPSEIVTPRDGSFVDVRDSKTCQIRAVSTTTSGQMQLGDFAESSQTLQLGVGDGEVEAQTVKRKGGIFGWIGKRK